MKTKVNKRSERRDYLRFSGVLWEERAYGKPKTTKGKHMKMACVGLSGLDKDDIDKSYGSTL